MALLVVVVMLSLSVSLLLLTRRMPDMVEMDEPAYLAPNFLALGIFLVVVTACSATLVYRLFFSPLSKIPGPWITRISGILEANALKDKRRSEWANELFAEYPGTAAVRTGPNSVSFNHPEAVKSIYGT